MHGTNLGDREETARSVLVFLSTAFAPHPVAGTVRIEFLLPDGKAVLDFIDDEAAGVKSLGPVGRGNGHHHGTFTDFQRADPVRRPGIIQAEALHGFPDDTLSLLLCDRKVCFILQPEYLPALVMVADRALEDGDGPGMRVACSLAEASRVDGVSGKEEHAVASPLQRVGRG